MSYEVDSIEQKKALIGIRLHSPDSLSAFLYKNKKFPLPDTLIVCSCLLRSPVHTSLTGS